MLPWTGCQARKTFWVVEGFFFSFSPYVSVEINEILAGRDFNFMDPDRADNQWALLINGYFVGLMRAVPIFHLWP